MKNFADKFPGIFFAIKCSVMGGLIMFFSMAAGEIFVDPEMYNGFLKKPQIWPLIFLESAVWLLPFLLLIIPMLQRLKTLESKHTTIIITASWIGIGLVIAVLYKLTYNPKNWSFAQMGEPNVTFGWTLPYSLILIAFIYFSISYVRKIREFQQ